MGSHTLQVTDAAFEEAVSRKGLVLVDFYADWCGPCRIVAPVLEELAKEMDGKLTIAKLDVDMNGRTAMKFGVMSIPTLILFKDGQPVDQIVGAAGKGDLQRWIQEHL